MKVVFCAPFLHYNINAINNKLHHKLWKCAVDFLVACCSKFNFHVMFKLKAIFRGLRANYRFLKLKLATLKSWIRVRLEPTFAWYEYPFGDVFLICSFSCLTSFLLRPRADSYVGFLSSQTKHAAHLRHNWVMWTLKLSRLDCGLHL